ncbi:MAG TPA: MBL fold metallo-hydrolase [Chryseolinea sp.]|nr:MBL fold metallo-hydrolase [Chryseolinea sp.]
MLVQPVCKGVELQQQIKDARKSGSIDSFDVWWLGQSGFFIQWNHKCLLFDPYLSDSLTKKYAATDKPHVRLSELVVEPQLLDCIDIVTSSHNHTDHLDAETLIPILQLNPNAAFIIPEANRSFVCERVKCDQRFPVGLNDGETIEVSGFTFHGVPAAHNTIERDEHGRCKFMGYVVQFGEFKVYHSGDTLWYPEIVQWLKPFEVDIAFLPINGNDPSRGVAGNLNGEEAARLGTEIHARLVIPHHYDLFAFNTADPSHFAKESQRYGQPYKVLRLGEKWTVQKP